MFLGNVFTGCTLYWNRIQTDAYSSTPMFSFQVKDVSLLTSNLKYAFVKVFYN